MASSRISLGMVPFVTQISIWRNILGTFEIILRSPWSILRVEPGTCKPLAVWLLTEAKCSAMSLWERVSTLWTSNMSKWRTQRIERRLNKNWRTHFLKVLVENHCHSVIWLVYKWLPMNKFIAIAMFRRCSSSCVRGPWHQCWGKVMGCTITIQHHYSWRKSLSTNGITSHRGILNTVDGTILHHSRVYENVLLLGYSHCFVHPEWCRISSFNSMFCKYDC